MEKIRKYRLWGARVRWWLGLVGCIAGGVVTQMELDGKTKLWLTILFLLGTVAVTYKLYPMVRNNGQEKKNEPTRKS
jgi:hypothetical protein